MSREELKVAAIKNGTVIDHIPNPKLFQIVRLLRLEELHTKSSIMVGFNLESNKMGHKSIIKISDKYFSDAELNQLSVVAPNVTLCIIRNFEVVEKRKVTLPTDLRGIVKCANPKCITNNEPMPTRFHLCAGTEGTIRCHYCQKEQRIETVKLV